VTDHADSRGVEGIVVGKHDVEVEDAILVAGSGRTGNGALPVVDVVR
jgi:hypothetical protein